MGIFIVFRVTQPEKLKAAIEERFCRNSFDLGNNEWLISDRGTAKDVSDKIGITDREDADLGSAIVFGMESYFGRASIDIWEWIKTKAEAISG